MNNKFKLTFLSYSENEFFARSVVSFFMLTLNPSVAQVSDVKTAVSEAVTNSIVHGYPEKVGEITLEGEIIGTDLHINVFDEGIGIENIDNALQPFYTTKLDDERSGMGFTIMKSFMDDVKVVSKIGEGTRIYMKKNLSTETKTKNAESK